MMLAGHDESCLSLDRTLTTCLVDRLCEYFSMIYESLYIRFYELFQSHVIRLIRRMKRISTDQKTYTHAYINGNSISPLP
jgi:hypothetical protein